MLANYIKLTLRNLKRQWIFSLINISGLALGMACCILILLFVQDELSYDTYHEKAEQIYRLCVDFEIGDTFIQSSIPNYAAAPAFTRELPGIKTFTRIHPLRRDSQLIYKDKRFDEEKIFFVDSTFFDIFSHSFVYGNPETAFDKPGAVVITEEIALKIFGQKNPLGERFKIESFDTYENLYVAGVVKTMPINSSFRFNYLISMATLQGDQRALLTKWQTLIGWSYLLLDKGVDINALQEKFAVVVESHAGQQLRDAGGRMDFFLQKLTDIHLRSYLNGKFQNNDITYVYIFSAVAIFILMIAGINFMNLSTARSTLRAKEVGIRKVSGAQKKNIMFQFLSESILISILGLILAIGIVHFALPHFNTLAEKEMEFASLFNRVIFAGIFCFTVFTGIVAGSYPAFILSSFQPVRVLKGKLSSTTKNSGLRKVLVVLQFSISIILIVCTIIVVMQVNFMKNKSLGFDKEQVLIVNMSGNNLSPEGIESLKHEMMMNSNILKATSSSSVPGGQGGFGLFLPDRNHPSDTHLMNLVLVDHDYLSTYKMQILQGRDFSLTFPTDATSAFIINEAAAEELGWAANAVGKEFTCDCKGLQGPRKGTIIGVIEDYHNHSVAEKIMPGVLMVSGRYHSFLSLKISAAHVSETIEHIKQKWTNFEPGSPLNYYFVDEDFASKYNAEEKVANIIGIFAILGLLIAALGLFGLVTFMVERRVKEIGIRKVLGASVTNLLLFISNEFAILLIISNIIAWPIAYFTMTDYWLINFPYRINPGSFPFLIAGLLSISITLIAVGYRATQAASKNPVEALRYE